MYSTKEKVQTKARACAYTNHLCEYEPLCLPFFSNNKDNFYFCPFEITVLRPLLNANKMIVLASFVFSVHLLNLKGISLHSS